MAPEGKAVLKIESAGNLPLYKVGHFLFVLERTYSYIYVGYLLLSEGQQRARWREALLSERRLRFARWVPLKDRLILRSVELHSPGSWEFLGKLNPLETIRQFLQDRHERRKDRRYKESAEERSLELDNMLKENQVLSGQIDNARKLGATDEDLRLIRERFIRRPLLDLDKLDDERIAGSSSVSREQSRGDRQKDVLLPQKPRRITLED